MPNKNEQSLLLVKKLFFNVFFTSVYDFSIGLNAKGVEAH